MMMRVFISKVDGDEWERLQVLNPNGNPIFDVKASRELSELSRFAGMHSNILHHFRAFRVFRSPGREERFSTRSRVLKAIFNAHSLRNCALFARRTCTRKRNIGRISGKLRCRLC